MLRRAGECNGQAVQGVQQGGAKATPSPARAQACTAGPRPGRSAHLQRGRERAVQAAGRGARVARGGRLRQQRAVPPRQLLVRGAAPAHLRGARARRLGRGRRGARSCARHTSTAGMGKEPDGRALGVLHGVPPRPGCHRRARKVDRPDAGGAEQRGCGGARTSSGAAASACSYTADEAPQPPMPAPAAGSRRSNSAAAATTAAAAAGSAAPPPPGPPAPSAGPKAPPLPSRADSIAWKPRRASSSLPGCARASALGAPPAYAAGGRRLWLSRIMSERRSDNDIYLTVINI